MAVIKVTEQNFKSEVLESSVPVLADFNANWCGPCRMLAPIVEEVSEERRDVKFVSINIDEEDILAEDYGISSIPCLVLFKGGEEVDRMVGLRPKDDLLDFLG